jgi:choline kinase
MLSNWVLNLFKSSIMKHIDPESDEVIILDGDILFDSSLLSDLINTDHANALIADNHTKIESEDSKVLIKDGFVQAVGKEVKGDAIYTSLIKLGSDFLVKFRKEVQKSAYHNIWYSVPLNQVLTMFPKEVFAIFTEGRFRCDVDTYEEYVVAKDTFQRLGSSNFV